MVVTGQSDAAKNMESSSLTGLNADTQDDGKQAGEADFTERHDASPHESCVAD